MSVLPRPFGFDRLPQLRVTDVDLVVALQSGLPPWTRFSTSLEQALQTPIVAGVTTIGVAAADQVGPRLTAGWLGALGRADGVTVGVAHVEASLVQAVAARVLAACAGRPEVRPLLPAEKEAMSLLFGVLLADSGLELVGRTTDSQVFDTLGDSPLGQLTGHLKVDGVGGWVTFWMVPGAWPRLPDSERAARRRRTLARSPLAVRLLLEVRVRLAIFEGRHRALLDLNVGDVLLPSEWRGHEKPTRGWLCLAGRPVVDVALDWSRPVALRITGPTHGGEHAMSDSDTSKRRTLEQMRPILKERTEQLEVVVGSASLPLGEILELQPGRTFALDVPVDGPVELVLDGRTIGRGELVEVGGRAGVRITSIAK